MEQTPYNRSQEALDAHITQCKSCKFINPINPKEGLCDEGQRLYRRLRYYAAGDTRDEHDGKRDDGGGVEDRPKAPRRRPVEKKQPEIRSWSDTLPKWRMEQLIPDHWLLMSYSIASNSKLYTVFRPSDYRLSVRSMEFDLSVCKYQDHEARRKWLEEVIRLELLYIVDRL